MKIGYYLKMISSLSEEKERLKEDNDSIHRLFNEKMAYLSTVEEQKIEIENHCQTLQHNYDTYKTKSNKLLEEKDGHIDQLKDRITVLEHRFQAQSLSGDDRVSDLETERDNLEKKLEESSKLLVEIKSTWIDKISHLEEQISHLNTKIVKDREDQIEALQQSHDSLQQNIDLHEKTIQQLEEDKVESDQTTTQVKIWRKM